MLAKAVELAQAHGWFLCRQFENEANADMHSRTTAPEILAAFEGERLDYWVTGYGTGGTLKGVARVLKAQRPETQVIVCEPDNSPILGSGIAQARQPDGTPSDSHPAFRPHLMQGWSPDFIPQLTEDALALTAGRPGGADQRRRGDAAVRANWRSAKASSAASPAARRWPARCRSQADAPEGANVLCMLPDTGERYLSTPLFDGIGVDMTDEELEISRSTPGVPLRCADVATRRRRHRSTCRAGTGGPEMGALVAQMLADPAQPVVLFALSGASSAGRCDGCWRGTVLRTEQWTWTRRNVWRVAGVPRFVPKSPEGRGHDHSRDVRRWPLGRRMHRRVRRLAGRPNAGASRRQRCAL